MTLDRILWMTLLSSLFVLFFLNYLHLQSPASSLSSSSSSSSSSASTSAYHSPHSLLNRNGDNSESVSKLIELIRIQNETIHTLEKKMLVLSNPSQSQSLKATAMQTLEKDLSKAVSKVESEFLTSNEEPHHSEFPTLVTKDREICESKYGMELASIWKRNREVWCEDSSASEHRSELICYPYHQAHKKLDGRSPDLICEATNFIVDFTKISGEHSTHKPALGNQYLHFQQGSLTSPCRKTKKYRDHLFMPHHSLQMHSFQEKTPFPPTYETVSHPTYLLARDEDCENAFHSTADFMNVFLVKNVLDLPVKDMQVMLFDKHTDGPFFELIQKAYSPNHPLIRHQKYAGKKVMFSRLIFHLESPAGLIFPKVSRPDPLRCFDMSLFQEYRKFILKSFDLLDVEPPPIPTVTVILRHRTPQKNVGRIMANEKDIVSILEKGNLMKLNVIDMAKMSYGEQLKMIRNSNVIVGIHGAGLMFIMFAAEEAVLVEIHPSYRQDRHFRHAARMTGKIYMPMRTTRRETCQGSSDNVFVEPEEFTKTMDGALRIARNFDDGLSECGLVCPKSILAIDGRLDRYYSMSDPKGTPLNLNFPCG